MRQWYTGWNRQASCRIGSSLIPCATRDQNGTPPKHAPRTHNDNRKLKKTSISLSRPTDRFPQSAATGCGLNRTPTHRTSGTPCATKLWPHRITNSCNRFGCFPWLRILRCREYFFYMQYLCAVVQYGVVVAWRRVDMHVLLYVPCCWNIPDGR